MLIRSVALSVTLLCAGAPAQSLTNPARPLLWTGTVTQGTVPAGAPPECSPGCQAVDVNLDLPPGVWTNKPGGVQIAVRWRSHTLGDNLWLYVYRDATLIAKSDGIISISQGVFIRDPANGTLRAYIAWDPDSPNPSISYEGLAEVEYDPSPRARPPAPAGLESSAPAKPRVRPDRHLL